MGGKRYADKESVEKLTNIVGKLVDQVAELAKWQAYYAAVQSVDKITDDLRKDVLERSKGHITHMLYEILFKTNPIES